MSGSTGVAIRLLHLALECRPAYRRRRISAMVRVRNEEEFLSPAVRSILGLVDEVVLIDNGSSDATGAIISRLRDEHPRRIIALEYPYPITRVGRENWEAAQASPRSPRLSSSYYTWCLRRCASPFVLKWDGDMIALPAFAMRLEAWRASGQPVMMFRGANMHYDRRHLIAARSTDRDALLGTLQVPGLPRWATSLTFDHVEPRLFPRPFARYDDSIGWTQRLKTPFCRDGDGSRLCHRVEDPCYLHMKFCKRDPLANYSPDLAAAIAGNIVRGPALTAEWLDTLRRWGVDRATNWEAAG